jgi:hypothetical protein
MDEAEWAIWSESNDKLWGVLRSESPCRDCTPLFHADMLDGGMCDGVPLAGDRPPKPVGPKLLPLDAGGRRNYWRLRRRESRDRARAGA